MENHRAHIQRHRKQKDGGRRDEEGGQAHPRDVLSGFHIGLIHDSAENRVVDGVPNFGNQEDAASLAQVRQFFTAFQFGRFADWDNNQNRPAHIVGYRKTDADGVIFAVLPDGWKEICKGRNPEKVARLCADAGWMSTPGGGRYQTLLRLPGGTNPARVYQFTMAMLGEEANQEEDLGRPRPVIALVK